MVHETYYGTQYVLTLNRVLDYYNDVLPLCTKFRTKFDLVNVDKVLNTCQLRVLFCESLDTRFDKNLLAIEWARSCDELNHHYGLKRETHFSLYKYKDVLTYSRCIKHKNVVPFTKAQYAEAVYAKAQYAKAQYAEAVLEYETLTDSNDCVAADFRRQCELENMVEIQRIVAHPAYYQEVMVLENGIATIELTEAEQTLVNRVQNEPVIQACLLNAGLDLISFGY